MYSFKKLKKDPLVFFLNIVQNGPRHTKMNLKAEIDQNRLKSATKFFTWVVWLN